VAVELRDRRKQPAKQRLIVDTGCPAALILAERLVQRLSLHMAKGIETNFGWLWGHAVDVAIPELSFGRTLTAHGSDRVFRIARDEGFDGIAGKALIDHFHWSNGSGGELCLETWEGYRARETDQASAPTKRSD